MISALNPNWHNSYSKQFLPYGNIQMFTKTSLFTYEARVLRIQLIDNRYLPRSCFI